MLEDHKYFQSSLEDQAYFLTEVATATKTGVYSVNFKENKFFIDAIGRSILEIPSDWNLSIVDAHTLFVNSQDIKTLLKTCLQGESFETDLQMVSYKKDKIWMRFTGKPRFDKNREVIGIRGVFTSIDRYIRDREEAQRHSRIIEAQNERLLHYTHIVSHNLRSHSSNLELTLELFKDVAQDERSKVFYSYMDEVSQNLSTTLKHLNQVVTIRAQSSSSSTVNINAAASEVLNQYQAEIDAIGAIVTIDFSAFDLIEYVPLFFKNILETFLSNAIKFRSRDRLLQIGICTKTLKDKKLFEISDNGRGIDLVKDEAKIFSVYKNSNSERKTEGLSLFLAKNQIEALGGDLVVKSELDKGTTFVIKF